MVAKVTYGIIETHKITGEKAVYRQGLTRAQADTCKAILTIEAKGTYLKYSVRRDIAVAESVSPADMPCTCYSSGWDEDCDKHGKI